MKQSVENLNFPPTLTANLGLTPARRLTVQTALPLRGTLSIVVFLALTASAAVHYVDVNSTNATPPYTNWATAATNIQDAVDAAVAGDEIVVTNGTYATGTRVAGTDSTPNRVAVDKPLKLRSVNGPQFTAIYGNTSSLTPVRCVYLSNGASVSGFTLTNGSTSSSSSHGGGVLCESAGAAVSNCVLTGNFRGGAWYCTLNNCTLTGNS